MPLPIQTIRSQPTNRSFEKQQDISTLIPMLQPFYMLQDIADQKHEKEIIRKVWIASKTVGKDKMEISASVDLNDLNELQNKGLLIKEEENIYRLTLDGSKLLCQSILNDEECALTKEASKALISKNSYDFGDEVLIRVQHPEKFGTRYIAIPKKSFTERKAIPRYFESYAIKTQNEDGSQKKLADYSEEELVQVLHLSKKIIDNSHDIIISGSKIKQLPIHRLASFSEMIMKELNSR